MDFASFFLMPTGAPAQQQNMAEAVSILLTHLLGDAASPYLVGFISDTLTEKYNIQTVSAVRLSAGIWPSLLILSPRPRPSTLLPHLARRQGDALMLALMLPVFVSFLGGLCFLRSAKFVAADRYGPVRSFLFPLLLFLDWASLLFHAAARTASHISL